MRGAGRAPGGPAAGRRPPGAVMDSTVSQTGDWHASRRRMPSSRIVKPSRPSSGLLDDRVVQAVAHQVQRHDRVHPRRLDAAPAAVGLLAGDDPVDAPAQRGAPGAFFGSLGSILCSALSRLLNATRPGVLLPALGCLPGNLGVQLVDRERQRVARLEGGDDRERDDRLPGPAAPVVDVQREPRRQVDDLRRDHRQVIPGPQAGQGQPDPGEDAGRGDAALAGDPAGRALHVLGVRVVARQLERDVGLDRGGQVAGAAVEVGPGAVLALLRADPDGGLRGVGLGQDAEEVPEQHVLGVHRHVGLKLADPPAARVLQAEQVVAGPGQRGRGQLGQVAAGRRVLAGHTRGAGLLADLAGRWRAALRRRALRFRAAGRRPADCRCHRPAAR